MRALALMLLVIVPSSLSGCAALQDLFNEVNRPNVQVQRTAWHDGEWTREPDFQVNVAEPAPHAIRIVATTAEGARLEANGTGGAGTDGVTLRLPDGTWSVTYWVDDYRWERLRDVRLDTTAPVITGLPTVLDAPSGSAVLGAAARVEAGATVRVTEQRTGVVVATTLPVPLSGLSDGVHAYDVAAEDPAGNLALVTVQVRVGDALLLPDGQYTFGIVARYRQDVVLWDLTELSAYLSREAARAAALQLTPGGYMGEGVGITPQDAAVQAVAVREVKADDNSIEAAMALFTWMAENLEYDEARLDAEGLLQPRETIDDGGGVCRDLAALYVSLLRAAGIPSRLVAGYLAGQVNGFHAWVEVYVGGNGPSPWLPVDVSGIDGPFTSSMLLQSFGIHLPGHLPLRALTEAQEDQAWSEALRVSYSYLKSEPDVDLAKDLEVVFETRRVLCIDDATRARRVAATGQSCNSPFFSEFVVSAEMLLDYGVTVASAVSGTTVTGVLSVPTGEPASGVEWKWYGAEFDLDAATGFATGTWKR